MKAVGSRDLATVNVLLEAGADPHETTQSGLTALKIAESLQENDIIGILKKALAY
jgi:ankyrin repeat protein